MGANRRTIDSGGSVRWCFLIVAVVVLLTECGHRVSADNQDDPDFVIDVNNNNGAENGNSLNHRTTRSIAHSTKLNKSSQKQPLQHGKTGDDSWVLNTAKRLKRQFFNWFDSETTTTTTTEQPIQQILDEDEEQEPKVDFIKQRPYDNDDEDLSGSGDGSAERPLEFDTTTTTTTTTPSPLHNQPRFYRARFTVLHPFTSSLEEKRGEEFENLSRDIEYGINYLYTKTDGTQGATVIEFSKYDPDRFKSLVTVDIGTRNFYEKSALEKQLVGQINGFNRIGNVTAYMNDFSFVEFQDTEHKYTVPDCPSNQIPCRTKNECFPVEGRCNFVRECSDGSDETGCPPDDDINESNAGAYPSETTESPITTTTISAPTTTATSSWPHWGSPESTSTEVEQRSCRADDVVRCADSSVTICADQECDGKEDCPNGEDEANCSSSGAGACAMMEFGCDITRCIPQSSRCDGKIDCTDGTDEQACKDIDCFGRFKCDNRCIDLIKQCDGYQDCRDGADEAGCSGPEGDCGFGFVRCADGTCVPGRKCDNYYDCSDFSDETNCTGCDQFQFACKNQRCIDDRYRCNDVDDCGDGSDEEGCATCPLGQFRCTDGLCISYERRCDGYHDCLDGSDEQDCPKCTVDQFLCDNGRCMDNDRRCDSYDDCGDRSDEKNCPSGCSSGQFACDDGRCIAESAICDGRNDCENGLDEFDCPTATTTAAYCESYEHDCGDNNCISRTRLCDGRRDCRDGSDERNCEVQCSSSEFRCHDRLQCVASYQRCDRRADCNDGSDEKVCPQPTECDRSEFRCDNGQCVPNYLRCNKFRECDDGSDERYCDYHTTTTTTTTRRPTYGCRYGERPCRSGNQCVRESAFCDGRFDCHDTSDEENCPGHGPDGLNLKTYPNEQEIKESTYLIGREVVFQCRDEGPARARVHWSRPNGQSLPPGSRDLNGRLEIPNIQLSHAGKYVCVADGYPDGTPGGRVEVNLEVDRLEQPITRPPQACALHEATCSNGDCIRKEFVCDGKFDCSDGSDETRCNPHGCEPNEYRCANKRCVLKTWVCDGEDDCGDRSDESNCGTSAPGSQCKYHEFGCHSGNQCIPKSYHCDGQSDCQDNSDEIGCSQVTIKTPPPPMVNLNTGDIFIITCTAVGIPIPQVVWRLNWGHIPEKCTTTSVDGFGTLTCPDIQPEDQGAYSCEAINIRGSVLATPDAILVVNPGKSVCPEGYFNEEAREPKECINCFCFGVSNACRSAELFTYQLPPPFDLHKYVGVHVDLSTGAVDVRDESSLNSVQPSVTPISSRNGVHALADPSRMRYAPSGIVPYFSMPENYHGNQLKSYGGYLKYTLQYEGHGRPTSRAPDVILSGNGYTLLHVGRRHQAGREEQVTVRFFHGEWVKRTESGPETLAKREEIMMALASVENILIKLQYVEDYVDTTISNIEMDSAGIRNIGIGQAAFVEECTCPVGYQGLSCENCAPGYTRHRSGPWLGRCYKEDATCPPGTYGDPSRGSACETCPCPLTNPSNQFARTCKLDYDGEVTCDCPTGYAGRRCQQCAPGYSGNPLIAGDSCRPSGQCNAAGANSTQADAYGRCNCKNYVQGPTCDQCKLHTFHLSPENQFGCVSCFCMGVTDQCHSSNLYRDTITTVFTNSKHDFKLVELLNKDNPIDQGVTLDQGAREIIYRNFSGQRSDVLYWSLPSRYLGDKVDAYGGHLRYTLRYVPAPGGLSSRNNAATLELISDNKINILYFSNDPPLPNQLQTFNVPLLEQYWQRSDGQKVDREHFLMALADLKAILIKATYTTNTREAALISVSLDIGTERNTGNERALAVEQCKCPEGYKGLSCEDCDSGYTRSLGGLYLGTCEPCNCNGHSNECNPETGECINCRDFTVGPECDRCLPGYDGDPANRIPCTWGGSSECNCDARGTIPNTACYNGVCQCKSNVIGHNCNICREGTYGLNANISEGCQTCFCSGVTTTCAESSLYVEQIPSQIIEGQPHGFTLTDQFQRDKISDASAFHLNEAMNEIGYTFRPSNRDRLFWSLPRLFTGNQIKSYGGRLEFHQRYTQRPQASYNIDQDVIVTGNGITIFWTNPVTQHPEILNKVSVQLSPNANWQRLEHRTGTKPASREDILKVLSSIDAILIRAQLSSDTASSFISDITLDTAISSYNGQTTATNVEVCKCPNGYRGTSCEECSEGFYRDTTDTFVGPLGSCSKCPCNNNEISCEIYDSAVQCRCKEGYYGRHCEYEAGQGPSTPAPPTQRPPVTTPTIDVSITTPSIQIVQTGQTVRFNCKATSRIPSARVVINWTKDGGDLPSDRAIDDNRGLLVIADVRVSDSGVYICAAQDGYSHVTETTVLTVGNQPTVPVVHIPSSIVHATEGETVEVRCTATGNPYPSISWTRIPESSLPSRLYYTDGVLILRSVQQQDEGIYVCTASNSAGTSSGEVRLKISDSQSAMRPLVNPPYYNGRTGEQFTLTCTANVPPRNIVWYKERDQLPYNSRQNGGVLYVYSPRVEDSGTYVCNATDYLSTSGYERVAVTITESSSITPSITIEPKNQTVGQGSNVEIRCNVYGVSRPIIKWTKVGETLDAGVDAKNPVLKLYNVQVKDRGVYVCVASNEENYVQGSSILDVEPRDPPRIELYPQEVVTVSVGHSVQLQCRIISGSPQPIVEWTRDDGRPILNGEVFPGGVLRFTNVHLSDEGHYVCTAENRAGKVKATAQIVVESPPRIVVTPRTGVLNIKEGEPMRLVCKADGKPNPHVRWEKVEVSGGHVESVGIRRPQFEAVEERYRTVRSDEGLYKCVAINSAGTAEEYVQIVVDTLPTRGDITGEDGGAGHEEGEGSYVTPETKTAYPEVFNEIFTAPLGTRTEMSCKVNSIHDTSEMQREWIRGDGRRLPIKSYQRDGTLYIDDVQYEDAGDYRCLIRDHTGSVLFGVSATLEILNPPKIVLNPTRQLVRPGDNARIECSATGEQPITITWHPVNRTMPSTVYYSGGILQFHSIKVEDAGMYRCSAVNSAGEADAVAEVAVADGFQRPSISASSKEQTGAIGATVTLHCRVYDFAANSKINWYREHKQLPLNSRVNGEYLQINNLQLDDAGRYFCEFTSPEGSASDYITLHVTGPSNPALDIQPSAREANAGDEFSLYCKSNEPGVVTDWSKVNGYLGSNVEKSGDTLTFRPLREEDSGTYSCEASGYNGYYEKIYELDVIPKQKEEPEIETKYAPRDTTVIMDCRTNLDEPVTYKWTKQGDTLSVDDDTQRSIRLNAITSMNAGTYVCTASNGQKTVDIPTILVVTNVLPYFNQAPNSYATLPTIQDAYTQFSFEISIRPVLPDGLVLYNGHRGATPNSDFISLSLRNGIPEFRIITANNVTVVRANHSIAMNEWHTIKVIRIKKTAYLYVDNEVYEGSMISRLYGLELSEPLYIGGVPNYNEISPSAEQDGGFVGCISRFKLGNTFVDIQRDAVYKEGITSCETCSDAPCQNNGVCQETLSKDGFTCICPNGYSGPTCNKVGSQSCMPGSCGKGRCTDTDDSFVCNCPIGTAGRRCEQQIEIIEPGFANNAYMAFELPQHVRRLKITLRAKPRTYDDGIVLYSGEFEAGGGNFVSLAIKDRYLEFRFDAGNGPVVVRSRSQIVPGEWMAISASRTASEGRLIVNGETPVTGRSYRVHKGLNLHTLLYIGGVDEAITVNRGVEVEKGFNGCVTDIHVSGTDFKIESAKEASNVKDCSAPEDDDLNEIESNEYDNRLDANGANRCTKDTCKNGGYCNQLNDEDYKCECKYGFSGTYCEIQTLSICEQQKLCKNGGTCVPTSNWYVCDCPLGYSGPTCEQVVELKHDVSFEGNGYIQLPNKLLESHNDEQLIALELSTNASDGIVFWQGDRSHASTGDHIGLLIRDGKLSFRFNLGTGEAIIDSDERINDGTRHKVVLKRIGQKGSIEIDDEQEHIGYANGLTSTLNVDGDIFLGNLPNPRMTGVDGIGGFKGCIHAFELQDSKVIDLSHEAIGGKNAKACLSESDDDDEEIVN